MASTSRSSENRIRTDKDPVRIVGCQLSTIVRHPEHLVRLRDAVLRVHRATIQASELLNLHVRRLLEANQPLPTALFNGNWAFKAWTAVSTSTGAVDPELRITRELQLQLQGADAPEPVSSARGGNQLFKAAADQFVSTAKTSLWLHFRKRVRSVVDCRMALTKAEYAALDADGRKTFKRRKLKVAWDAWGVVAGRPGQIVNRGKAPCLGVGLMKRVAKVLPVVKTPEHMTSQTCCRCGGHCGRHHTVEDNRLNDHPWWGGRREIRGLRLCENSECRKPLNRDANAAVNIGTNFLRLYCGLPPIAAMTAEEATLTALQAAEPQEEETA